MKKNLMSMMAAVLLVVGFAACGSNKQGNDSSSVLSEETKKAIYELLPEDGILGPVAREIALTTMEIDTLRAAIPEDKSLDKVMEVLQEDSRFERYAKGQMSSREEESYGEEVKKKTEEIKASINQEIAEAKAKWSVADSTWKVRCQELTQQFSTKDIPTELEEGIPLKLVRPFRVKELSHTKLILECIVELTEDRNPVSYFMTKECMPTFDIVNDEYEPYVLSSQDLSSGRELKAGQQFPLEKEISITKVNQPYSTFALFMAAKKLVVLWEQPFDMRSDIHIRGDRGIFELLGNVKSCVWKNSETENTFEFDANGKWIAENGEQPWANYPIVDRDFSRRVTSMSNGDEGQTFNYNDHGLIVKRNFQYMDGGSTSRYYYNVDGECVKKKVYYVPEEEGDDGVLVYTFTIMERDSHGNWTKRKDQNDNLETRQITYFE